ncbi:flavodoxin domain-containing protein [Yoonia sediminilitoris]|uniref:Menaquinone-dependent protoporphyrinogen oxidase n=1 Tax=Yoonia sediminilitoris TaxID=1286148 RepID=A0A2T6KET8_9RHOB|nr:flavodoxin domain-containing protein [Yoonia sediminilitoris]PUB13644.1 menaquinone-dependent protoporphyrinogen oxidase [Yoonia sediminilitoris]RCW94814.1 menaquinone-dependent protoporphyrinogen oxidase [Yoonia sediminilitoris]
MTILIAYASTEGQTRKIARYCADYLNAQGHSVELSGASDAADAELNRFDAVLLAGSVHLGKYQKPLVRLARKKATALAHMKAAFISVSLAAAGTDEDDWQGLRDCVANFASKTGWTPQTVMHVAGAFRFSEYDYFKSMAMRWIASQKDQEVDPHHDKEFTDWAALKTSLDAWLST